MLLTMEELVQTLRSSVNVQNEESEVIDPAFLVMSDEELILFIKLGVSRAYPKVEDLSELPSGAEYPVILLSKIELYTKLAVMKADKVDMGVDNNNYLKQDQRFQHYMKLVQTAKEQYDTWLDNEGQGEVNSFNVLLDRNHHTSRNYELQMKPKVKVHIDNVASDCIEFHWNVSNVSHFALFKVYVSESPIVDMFKEGAFYKDKLSDKAHLILSTHDIRNTFKRVSGLSPEVSYHIAVLSVERNQVWGYEEVTVSTPPLVEDDEEIDTDVIPPSESEE